MSGSVNKVTLVGRLVKDPEIRRTQGGDPVVSIRMATSEKWTEKATGERKERSEYHAVVIYNEGIASVAERYLKKGSNVYLEGQLQTRKWQDQQGQERYATEVVLQKFKGALVLLDSGSRDDASPPKEGKPSEPQPGGYESEIPF